MISTLQPLARTLSGLLAVSVVCLLPTAAQAQSVTFRNDCNSAVIVQTATVIRGTVVRDQPQLLRSLEYSAKIKTDIDRIVTIYDAKTNQVLFREVLKATTLELGFSIHPDPKVPNRVRLATRKVANGRMEKD